ncbi:MAG: non-homologous end-joining DNA ligase [Acidimicrobiales bacterium]|jgi:bifunctional non-homologous end joining protein LigD
MPSSIKPMLAAVGKLPTDDGGWSYEFKWDGIRAVAYVAGGRVTLKSRNDNDLTPSFPELQPLGQKLGSHLAILDGEVVAFDGAGRPSFQLLQPRIHSSDAAKAARLAEDKPVTFILFDLLYLDGESLLDLPYDERRRRLDRLALEQGDGWTVSPRFDGPGVDVLRASQQQGLEGILAKRTESPYRPGKRSPEWTKVKNLYTQEAVIGGWTPGQGHRANKIGSLLLGIPDGKALIYIGQVGTGFTEQILSDLVKRLGSLEQDSSPFAGEIPTRYRKNARWAEPRLVGEVTFSEWTAEGRLRHPVWRGLRDDKQPAEVIRES